MILVSYQSLPYCEVCLVKTCETNEPITMSYYHRFMTGMYRSYWPHLNRSLRSCSAPRHVPEPVPSRISRAASTPFYSSTFTQAPRYEREVSVPRQLSYSYDTRYSYSIVMGGILSYYPGVLSLHPQQHNTQTLTTRSWTTWAGWTGRTPSGTTSTPPGLDSKCEVKG